MISSFHSLDITWDRIASGGAPEAQRRGDPRERLEGHREQRDEVPRDGQEAQGRGGALKTSRSGSSSL